MKPLISTLFILFSLIISFMPNTYAEASYNRNNWFLFEQKGTKKEYINLNNLMYDKKHNSYGIHIKYSDTKKEIIMYGVMVINCNTKLVTFTPLDSNNDLMNGKKSKFKIKRKDLHYQVFCK